MHVESGLLNNKHAASGLSKNMHVASDLSDNFYAAFSLSNVNHLVINFSLDKIMCCLFIIIIII